MTGDPGERLAEAIRELTERIATTTAPDAALAAAEAAVRGAIDRLDAEGTQRTVVYRMQEARADPLTYRRLSPVSGVLNPIAAPVRYLSVGDGIVEATATFGLAYEGPPGYVHGAFIAGAFDDVLGAANVAGGSPGMTVKLEVRYRRPTPLRIPLRIVARHTGREGRRIFAQSTMLAGDEVTAEADGVFAEITMDRARKLFGFDPPGEGADEAAL